MRKNTAQESPYQWILKKYPPVISKEQFYKVCGISKKTALHYLENGLIPCENTGKKTHRYIIKTVDVVHFLETRDKSPNDYHAPSGWYSHKSNQSRSFMSSAMKRKLKEAVLSQLSYFPDLLTVEDVGKITGYSNTTISKWCQMGKIQHFNIRRKFLIPKVSLIEFIDSDKYRLVYVKAQNGILRKVKE